MNKKIIFIITTVVVLLSMLCLAASASTVGMSVNYQTTFTPSYIVMYSHDEVVVSNSYLWNGGTSSSTTIEGAYELDIDSDGSYTTYSLGNSFDTFDLYFDPFYADNVVGPFPSTYFEIECIGNTQLVIDVIIYYEVSYYLGDGSLMTVEHTEYIQSQDNTCAINVRNYATQEANRNGWISAFDVVVNCSEGIKTFTITETAASNYGVVMSPRILENINVTQQVVNPNILEWVSTSLSSFLDTDIFPDISIGEMLFVIVAIPLAITFLKFFAGG